MRALTLPSAAALTLGAFATWPSHAAVLLSENFDELTPNWALPPSEPFIPSTARMSTLLAGRFSAASARRQSREIALIWMEPAAILLVSCNQTARLPSIPAPHCFDLIGSQRGPTDSVTVTFGPSDETFVLASNDNSSGIVSNAVVTVTAPTSSFLTFQSNDPPGSVEGELLDNVLITSQSTAVPEPASLSLLAGALLGFSVMRRRRNRM